MSNEESYLAIKRYLTDEREPYAPGTHGNTKRKIRKAAACYVVRNGTLYFQRRQRGLDEFTELEVVLQDERKKELLDQSHITTGGEHLNQQQTWESISQKYWWRGILRHVKDYIRECSTCQNRQDRRGMGEDGSRPRPVGRPSKRRMVVHMSDDDEEEEEEGDEDETLFGSSQRSRSKLGRSEVKHELVFVDSKGMVKQVLAKHGQTMLVKLNEQRLSDQFCDITLLIEGEEHRAHKAVLAACSDYFSELFVEKGAVSTHEAVVDLSGFTKASFLPLLDFAYTSNLTFNFQVMADIATLARHLLMAEVLEICETVHKQVEEQKLMVYQRGDTHTVVSSQPAPVATQEFSQDSGTYVVTIQSDGQAVVTHAGEAVAGESLALVTDSGEALVVGEPEAAEAAPPKAEEEGEESVAVVTHGNPAVTTRVTLVSGGGGQAAAVAGEAVTLMAGEGETLTVVTHSGQAGASDSLAVVSACLALDEESQEEEEPAEAFVISVDPDKVTPSEVVRMAAPVADQEAAPTPPGQEGAPKPQTAQSPPRVQVQATATSQPQTQEALPPPQKRKRGRPAKVKQVVVEEEEVMSPEEEVTEAVSSVTNEEAQQDNMSDDPYRRRLRQRSMGEGGYARMHMGVEEEEEEKKGLTPQRTTTPKMGHRPGKRGRPPKRPPKEEDDPPWSEDGADPEATPTEGGAAAEGGAGGAAEAGSEEPEPGGAEAGAKPKSAQQRSAVDGEHSCSECGLSFQRRYALIMHTLKHEKARGYKCHICSKEFQYAASLRAHLARHKQQSGQRAPLPAPRAPAADGEPPPDDELAEADGPGPAGGARVKREFVCDICGKTLPKLYSLRIHMLNHTGVRPHACRVCGKTFAHKHSLKMHRALHDVSKQFPCSYCHKSFVSKRSMEEHTSLHTGEHKYLCNTCGAAFHRASGLSKHLKKHLPKPEVRAFACSHCDKSFYQAKDLQQHMNKHMGLKPFQCQECGKCYSWKKDWYSHVKSHTVDEPYKCNICGKEFFEKALFRRHVKKATHGKKGRVKQNLERECEHCGRKFTQLREYRRHVNNHQGVKPFECLTCGVAWADARSLKRHVRTHTGERPYVCPMCQEAHIDARTLRKHMAKFHCNQLPGKIMLEKDTLQFHNQGTQVEHAVSILASDLPPELRPSESVMSEEIETVLITEETVEAVEAVQAVGGGDGAMATLSDQSIMQVVNYVLAQQAGLPSGAGESKMEDVPEVIQTMEVLEVSEVAHVAEVTEVE